MKTKFRAAQAKHEEFPGMHGKKVVAQAGRKALPVASELLVCLRFLRRRLFVGEMKRAICLFRRARELPVL